MGTTSQNRGKLKAKKLYQQLRGEQFNLARSHAIPQYILVTLFLPLKKVYNIYYIFFLKLHIYYAFYREQLLVYHITLCCSAYQRMLICIKLLVTALTQFTNIIKNQNILVLVVLALPHQFYVPLCTFFFALQLWLLLTHYVCVYTMFAYHNVHILNWYIVISRAKF